MNETEIVSHNEYAGREQEKIAKVAYIKSEVERLIRERQEARATERFDQVEILTIRYLELVAELKTINPEAVEFKDDHEWRDLLTVISEYLTRQHHKKSH